MKQRQMKIGFAPEQLAKLQAEAQRRSISLAALVRQICAEALEKRTTPA